jgi:hypothetical protein
VGQTSMQGSQAPPIRLHAASPTNIATSLSRDAIGWRKRLRSGISGGKIQTRVPAVCFIIDHREQQP